MKRAFFSRILTLGFEVGLVLLLAVAGLAYQSARTYMDLSELANESLEILESIDHLKLSVTSAETAQRALLLTGLTESKDEFENRLVQVQLALDLFRTRADRFGSQKQELDEIRSLVDRRLTLLKRALNARLFLRRPGVQPDVVGDQRAITEFVLQGSQVMKRFNAELDRLKQHHDQIYLARTENLKGAAQRTGLIATAGALMALGFLGFARRRMHHDMLALREQERALISARNDAERANRSKSQFLANLSHEIRTPMNAIVGMATVLAHGKPRDDQRESIKLIQKSARSLLALVQDLLDLSSIEAGRIRFAKNEFRLRDALADAVELMRSSLVAGVELSWSCEPSLPQLVRGDRSRLEQILLNLIANSAKFTNQGFIEVRAEAYAELTTTRPLVRFSVRDSGTGIAETDLNRLFQPFTQLDDAPVTQAPGTGLGLSICKRLVETMGGSIGVESEPGRGSTFWFTLPLDTIHAKVSGDGARLKAPGSDPSRGRVLVVDDNEANRLVAARLLEILGFEAVTVSTGMDALREMKTRPYAAVLMDVMMPEMDGYQTTAEVRRWESEQPAFGNGTSPFRTPILAMTAHASEGERERSLASGMDDHLSKPLDLDLLKNRLDRFAPATERTAPASV